MCGCLYANLMDTKMYLEIQVCVGVCVLLQEGHSGPLRSGSLLEELMDALGFREVVG